MTACLYYYGNSASAHGTRLILPTDMIDILGYRPAMIRKMLLSEEDDIYENIIFTPNHGLDPGWCGVCCGSGKEDWISSAMSRRIQDIHQNSYAREFKRNKKRVLFYEAAHYNHGYDFSRAFAPAQVEESKAEYICKSCSGTGLKLDGRHRLFGGMPGIRNKLKEFEWDGLNLPDISWA